MTDTTSPRTTEMPEAVAVAVNLQDLRGPTGLSPSSMGKYLNCPLSFYFYAIARISEPASEQSTLGLFVHSVLERLLALPAAERTRDAARNIAHKIWPAFSREEGFVQLDLDEAAVKDWKARAWKVVEGYFDIEDPTQVDVQARERRLETTVGGVPVRGSLDRLERDAQGRLLVTDYKTGRVPIAGFGVARLEQLHFYCLMVEATLGERPTYAKLIFANADEPTVIKGKVTDAKCAATQDTIVSTWASIQADMDAATFTATPNRLCDFCSHRPYCPAWSGDLAEAPAGNTRGDGASPAEPLAMAD